MAATAELTALIKQVPGNDGDWFKGMKWEDAAKICDGVLANTGPNVAEIVASLKEADDGKDFQPRYLLHILVTYVGAPDKAAQKAAVLDALIASLSTDCPKAVKGTVIREIQFLADPKAAKAIAPFLADEALNADTAKALLNMPTVSVDIFLAALPASTGRSRATIVQSLGVLADPAVLPALRAAASDKDVDTQVVAIWGLARMGDAGSVDVLITASDAPSGYARIQAGQASILLADKLTAAGKKAEAAKIYKHLKETRTDPTETYIVELATRALAG